MYYALSFTIKTLILTGPLSKMRHLDLENKLIF